MSALTAQVNERTLVARAYLSAVAEPPAPALVGFIAEHGAERAAELVRRGALPPQVADEVEARREHVDGEELLREAESCGARLVVPEAPEWPHEVFSCFAAATEIGLPGLAPPVALWARGRSRLTDVLEAAVAVVGARAASGYGEHLAAEFGYGLAARGFTVVSGAAYGIDGAAHRGTLGAGGTTLAFLACGVDVDYPAGHGRLLRAVAQQGLVLSEYPPGASPHRHRFLVRNRLIAGAGQGTVVVEAGARSGAANTANTADTLGRPLMAVPGPVTSASSVGCHEMVRAGKAVLVTGVDDIVEVVSPLGLVPPAGAPVGGRRATDGLAPMAKRVYEALAERTGSTAEQLALDSGVPLRKVRALLPELELSGLALLGETGWKRCSP